MMLRSVAASAVMFSVLCAAPAMAISDPIPGIDVIVNKVPGGIAMKSADCKPPIGTLKQDAHGTWVCMVTSKTTTGTGASHN